MLVWHAGMSATVLDPQGYKKFLGKFVIEEQMCDVMQIWMWSVVLVGWFTSLVWLHQCLTNTGVEQSALGPVRVYLGHVNPPCPLFEISRVWVLHVFLSIFSCIKNQNLIGDKYGRKIWPHYLNKTNLEINPNDIYTAQRHEYCHKMWWWFLW